jgi:signal transduction histidine kinase
MRTGDLPSDESPSVPATRPPPPKPSSLPQTGRAFARPHAGLAWTGGVERLLRAVPIRWRIMSIAAVNTVAVLLLVGVIVEGARTLAGAWGELRQVRQSERLLASLESEAVRLQGLIHRYINEPDPDVLTGIVRRGWTLSGNLTTRAALDPALSGSVRDLVAVNERLLDGFDELRGVQTQIGAVYSTDILGPARAIPGLFTTLDVSVDRSSPAWPALGRAREAFSAALAAANSFHLSRNAAAAAQAREHLGIVERSLPTITDLTTGDTERAALQSIGIQAAQVRAGIDRLLELFATRDRLLHAEVEGNEEARMAALDALGNAVRTREARAQADFDAALASVYWRLGIVSVIFLVVSVLGGIAIAMSISRPLRELRNTMHAIVGGDYARVHGLDAQDEIGSMARAVAVFRENAFARQRAEAELRTAKERAEGALADLQDAQDSLIEAEKLAALGGLVAGVAHEVNNPVGISLTVASSLARRCEIFQAELAEGQLRRSRLVEFVEGNRDAANQLVANLQRAGELIQAFKQVAVDRSHLDRRHFDLGGAVDQIMSSLRPSLKKSKLELELDIPEGIGMDSYPGPLGQVLTNLFLNALAHAYPDGRAGTIRIRAQRVGAGAVELAFTDDGVGMSADVQRRAFDPFFTTRRSQGGTGLGLHIVYNLVTARFGGEIALHSRPGGGTTFRLTLPLVAPYDTDADAANTQTDRKYG